MHFGFICLFLSLTAPAVSEALFQLEKLLKVPSKAHLLPGQFMRALLSQTPWKQNGRGKKKSSNSRSAGGGSMPPRPAGCLCNSEVQQSDNCSMRCAAKQLEERSKQEKRGGIQPGAEVFGKPLTGDDWANAKTMTDKPETNTSRNVVDGMFEGDIDLGGKSLDDYKAIGPFNEEEQSSAVFGTDYRWNWAEVPYAIAPRFSAYERSRIAAAFQVYHDKTCVKFVPWNGHSDYIYIFMDTDGCWSSLGRQTGPQLLGLVPSCTSGVVQHELMHALGFVHEQSRPDRDSYVTIVYKNIQDGKENDFLKFSTSFVDTQDISYDYGSVMHYGAYDFSINKDKKTIVTKNGESIGQRTGLSELDIKKVNKMYQCG